MLETDAKSGKGVAQFSGVIRETLKEKLAAWNEKGQVGRPIRAMVVGIPNVGKSTFINKVARAEVSQGGGPPRRDPRQTVGGCG